MSIRRSLATGLVVCLGTAAALLSSPVYAGAANPYGPQVKEEIFVTGSRIGRDKYEFSSPVDVFTTEDFKQSGAISVDEFLQQVPAFTGFTFNTSTNNGNNGVKQVDLRGLGTKRTLVLINGRRQVSSFAGGPDELGSVDLNTIPMFMVERIEVLKDGASTTYGSDALGGVINIILRQNYEGAEINGDIGYASEDWDAKRVGLNGQIGAQSDKGWVNIGVGWQEQKEIKQADRSWAESALWPISQGEDANGNLIFQAEPSGSSNARTGRTYDDLNAAILSGGGPDLGSFVIDPNTGDPRPFTNADVYNYAPVNALVTPNETWNLAGAGKYAVIETSRGGSINFFGELQYTKRSSAQRLAPDASFNVDDDFNCDSSLATYDECSNDWVPASNPFNPFGVNGGTLNPWGVTGFGNRVNRRFEESGGRRFIQEVNTFRTVAGFDGEFNNGIGWDVAYIFADNQEVQETKFYSRFDRWTTIVDPNLCSADSDCVAATGPENAFNPYSTFGNMTQDEINYLFANSLKDISKNRMQSFQINLDGSFGELQGGPIGWAAGYERRRESAEFIPDEFSAEGLTTSGAQDPLGGSYTVGEFYAETLLPVLAGKTMFESLNIELAARYSDYNTSAGDKWTGKIGLDWALVESFRIRTAYSTGFRAPNIVELYSSAITDFPTVEDPCEFFNRRTKSPAGTDLATIQDNCANVDGLPDDFEYEFQNQAAYTQVQGPELKPETSTNFTFGGVWTPLDSLSMSLDYWAIEVEDYIALPDYNRLMFACYSSPGKTSDACALFTGGDPRAGDSLTSNASAPLANSGTLDTAGVDWAIDYNQDVGWGAIQNFFANFSGTWLQTRETTFPLVGTTDYVGTAQGGEVYPEWRWVTNLGIGGNSWTASWKMRFYGEADDFFREPALTDDAVSEDILYNDLKFGYTWDQISINLGIDNVGNKTPPRFHSAFNANTEPGVYDVLGRYAWARLGWAF